MSDAFLFQLRSLIGPPPFVHIGLLPAHAKVDLQLFPLLVTGQVPAVGANPLYALLYNTDAIVGSRCSGGAFGRLARFLFPTVTWLRPDGRNLRAMLDLLRHVCEERAPYAQFMLHSSELMPGGSPRFSTRSRIERLYDHLEQLFEAAHTAFRGTTLAEFHAEWAGQKGVLSCV